MKWENHRQSKNIEDRRFESQKAGISNSTNLLQFLPLAKKLMGTKFGPILLIAGAALYFGLGINPLQLLEGQIPQLSQSQPAPNSQADDRSARFTSAILAQTEDVWQQEFRNQGMRYTEPKLVLFRNSVNSGCGFASSQLGPFYCPADKKAYLDLSFFDELATKYGAPGDLAQAYVIAHEIGHHIQNLTGTLNQVHQAKQGQNQTAQNKLQVQVELQADCYAGFWAKRSNEMFNSLQEGDLDSALKAANAIGDDTLQKQHQGYVVPDSFTHGTSQQRKDAFMQGFTANSMQKCQF